MNRLQGIDPAKPLFVTLNPGRDPASGTVFGEWTYEHPQFDAAALAAQSRLPSIQGRNNTHFAGAWTGYVFMKTGFGPASMRLRRWALPFRGARPA